ncbi:hypothetical protein DFH05DRAFT_860335 [Lentinula detonsa]|uniref:Uncharacterized protein n=1 Tax=Lentinula detonsa TaxID=2804962 RepID=A0A9W8P6H9_9AGAR|nr:hypothetical protein DFH05DRAFT_860335 [Lentinula detonsa]
MASNAHQYSEEQSAEDILNDALLFLGGRPVIDDEVISYGPLKLTVAPKAGKANTLLADHLFSPALFLAERIEQGVIPLQEKTLIELAAVTTDYPDPIILGNLRSNAERNQVLVPPTCKLHCRGYEWGQEVTDLLNLLPRNQNASVGFDIVILSDLLHFQTSHDVLVRSLSLLLAKTVDARVYVAAGKYTLSDVCSSFLLKAANAGLVFEEDLHMNSEDGSKWQGTLPVSGLDPEALGIRKNNCRSWVGHWLGI